MIAVLTKVNDSGDPVGDPEYASVLLSLQMSVNAQNLGMIVIIDKEIDESTLTPENVSFENEEFTCLILPDEYEGFNELDRFILKLDEDGEVIFNDYILMDEG